MNPLNFSWPELRQKILTWQEWGKPAFFGAVITLTALLVFFGGRPDLVGREFSRCNSETDLFVSNTYGYSLCLPKDWRGHYGTVNLNHEIDFVYVNGSSTPVLFFALSVLPASYWDLNPPARGGWQMIGRDGDRVFATLRYEGADPNTSEEYYQKLAKAIPGIEQTIAFSSFKSIDEVIEDNLARLALKPHGGRAFVAYEILGRDEINDEAYKYYVWLYSKEYYEQKGQVLAGGEMSVPVMLGVQKVNGNYVVGSFEAPGTGQTFFKDVKRIFPERIATSEWFSSDLQYVTQHVDVLKVIATSKAQAFYGDRFPRAISF